MKRIITAIVIVIIAAILLVPVPLRAKDGGTVVYQAILYSVTDVHSFKSEEEFLETGKRYNEGIIVKILGFEVFNNVE